jgi:DNA recombination protein RmuC
MFFLVAAGVAAIMFLLNKKMAQLQTEGQNDKGVLMLQQQLNQMMETMDRKLVDTNNTLDRKLAESFQITKDQFSHSSQFMQGITKESRELLNQVNRQSQAMIKDVTERLTKLDETNRQVVDFTSQLKNLQDILKNPKQRGVLGEYFLEETLKNVLPPNNFQMQYKFSDGNIVDAVVFVKEKIIPIDSKFSLENYEQLLKCPDNQQRDALERQFKLDLKNRIDETSKYVKPEEKTMDFAFMFIPSESIYYDLLVNKVGTAQVSSRDLIEYAFKEKHVIIVSPTSFLAYLQTVLQGLRALQIEESAKLIQKNVENLAKHLQVYQTYLEKAGGSLGTTVNHFNKAQKEFGKIDKDIVKITQGAEKVLASPLEEVEKPRMED